ncbi:MAG: hypothetical protein WCJ28_01760 [Actinomycetota bacterium]
MNTMESVVNLSEGRSPEFLKQLAEASASCLLDLHSDRDHHRSVATLAGTDEDLLASLLALCELATESLSLEDHDGVHPRLGVIDVVPFIALGDRPASDAVKLRDHFAAVVAARFDIPVFLYGALAHGGERSLPELRKRAFVDLAPDFGPLKPHPQAGAICAGARDLLVAWNLLLEGIDLTQAKAIASEIRGSAIRALAFEIEEGIQISLNLIDPLRVGPAEAYDLIAKAALERGGRPGAAELVGLVPEAVLLKCPEARWAQVDLSPERTIEARLAAISGSARET